MRNRIALVAMVLVLACGPETVRATGAPSTTQPAAATASAARTASTAPATTSAPTPVPTATTTAPTSLPSPTATGSAPSTPAAVASPALAPCVSEQALRPRAPGASVPFVVSNDTGGRLDLSSLDASGRRVPSRSLAPGESYTQSAHVAEVWVVSAPNGGCIAVYTVVAPALLIVTATRSSLVPLYAIRGRVTDAQTGGPLPGQSVFIWAPDESSCAIIGGSGSPGYVVSSITAPDGTYGVYVTRGDYKVRIRTAPVNGVAYGPRWWRDKPASTAAQCAAADIIQVSADATAIDFALQRQ